MPNVLRFVGNHLVWDDPVDDDEWEVLINGQRRTMSIDCILSEDQTAPPFRLFASMHGQMFRSTKDRLIRENREHIKNPKQWKISSRSLHEERVGLTKFVGMPVLPLVKVWRKVLDPQAGEFLLESTIGTSSTNLNGIIKVSTRLNYAPSIPCSIQWPGAFRWTDIPKAATNMIQVREDFVKWLRNNTKGSIYPFSDFKSTFECEDDEWAYMTDFHPALDTDPPSR